MQVFQTDRSGKTWHIQRRDANDIAAYCGVSNRNTQWTRQQAEQSAVDANEKVCPRCFTNRRWARS